MKTMIAIFTSLFIFVPHFAHATAMSEERSKCFIKESMAERYKAWKNSFQKFNAEYESLTWNEQFIVSREGLKKIVKTTEDFANETELRAPNRIISQAKELLHDLEAGVLNRESARKVMRSGLIKFEDAMDDLIYRAQVKYPSCDIETTDHSFLNHTDLRVIR